MSKNPLMAFAGHQQAYFTAQVRDLEERHQIGVVEAMERLAQPDAASTVRAISDEIARLMRGTAVSAFPITVDYGQRLSAMITAGNYGWTNSDITEKHFPVNGKGTVEIEVELIHFNRPISSDGAIDELDTQGLRSATLPELLAFGAKYPDEQRKYPIVALGSVWRYRYDGRYVPFLCSGSDSRDLDLIWFEDDWDSYDRFAAVRK